jgi:hypothetical protein
MKTITLYRNDFKDHSGGISFFEDVLSDLGINESERNNIDIISFNVDNYEIEN